MTPETRAPAAAPLNADAVTGLVHLYRAEVGRMTANRQRLDSTTTWAITTSGLVVTFALGTTPVSHVAYLFLALLLLLFLSLEGRRFRSFAASQDRVLFLERAFFPQLLDRPAADPRWVDALVVMLQNPTPPLSRRAALAERLRSTYLWMLAAVLLVWVVKLDPTSQSNSPLDVFARASVGSVPGWLVIGGVAIGYALLLAFALVSRPNAAGVDRQTEQLLGQDRD